MMSEPLLGSDIVFHPAACLRVRRKSTDHRDLRVCIFSDCVICSGYGQYVLKMGDMGY